MIASGRNTGSQLHTDPNLMGAWNLLLTGRKWWVILPAILDARQFSCDESCSPSSSGDQSNAWTWFEHVLPQIKDKRFFSSKASGAGDQFCSGFTGRMCFKLSSTLERSYIYRMASLTPFTTWTLTLPWPTTTSSLTPSGPWWRPWDWRSSPSQQGWLAGRRRQLFIISTWPPAEPAGKRYGTRWRELPDCKRIIKTFHSNIISSLYFYNYTEIVNKVRPPVKRQSIQYTHTWDPSSWTDLTILIINRY